MSCEWREKIGPYADDELAPAARQEFSAHLAECSECTAALAEQLALKKAVRTAASKFAAPPELHAAIYRQLHPEKQSASWWRWTAMAAGLAAVVLAVFLVFPRSVEDKTMVAGLVDQHLMTLASVNPVDVQSPDTHKIRPWFQNRVPFTFFLPNVEGSSFSLVGAKQVFVQQKPGAQIFYTAGGHKVSVFIFQASDNARSSPSWKRERSFNSCSWREGGLEFHMITDASQDEAYRLAEMFEQVNHS
ncbi:MAG TPA: zf-HC2 domain-containing protein [Candidatus Angelobacter sp.]